MSHPHDPPMYSGCDRVTDKWIHEVFSPNVKKANERGEKSCTIPVLADRTGRDITHFLFVAYSITNYMIEDTGAEYKVSWQY
jgi:hypothetical protein